MKEKEEFFIYVTQNQPREYSLRRKDNIEDYLKDIRAGEKVGFELIICFTTDNRQLVRKIMSLCSDYTKEKMSLSDLEDKVNSLSK